MVESKFKPIPKFKSVAELAEFFDTHDMGDYWDQMPKARFDIDLKKSTHVFAIDKDLAEKLTAISKKKHIPSTKLINAWLREKIAEQARATR
jgi:hypothetical protein